MAEYAKREGISRVAAYNRIRSHLIPFVRKGRIEFEVADRILAESMDRLKQAAGRAGGQNGKAESPELNFDESPLFSGEPQGAQHPEASRMSLLGRVQLQRTLLQIQRERMVLDEKKGELVSRAEAVAYYSQLMVGLKTSLTPIAAELADDLAASLDPVECRKILQTRIDQALKQIAAWRPRRTASLEVKSEAQN